jgi:hypothetical protein
MYDEAMSTKFDQCQLALNAYLANPARRWFETAELLLLVEQTDFWSVQASSFSQWLTQFSARIHLSVTSLWRFKSAYETLLKTREKLENAGYKCRSLATMGRFANPENLEIFERLTRVLSPADALSLGSRVVMGQVSRSELREQWKIYRPALEGKTARGHGVIAPVIDDKSKLSVHKLKAQVLTSITSKPHWLESSDTVAKVFSNVRIPGSHRTARDLALDLVVVVKNHISTSLDIHIIETFDTKPDIDQLRALFDQKSNYGHYFWFATDLATGLHVIAASLPEHSGLLLSSTDHVAVGRQANPTSGHDIEKTAMELLKETLKK